TIKCRIHGTTTVGRTAVKDEGHPVRVFVDVAAPAGVELSIALLLPCTPDAPEFFAATVGSRFRRWFRKNFSSIASNANKPSIDVRESIFRSTKSQQFSLLQHRIEHWHTGLDELLLKRDRHGVSAVLRADFRVDVAQVRLDGDLGDAEPLRDLLVGGAGGDQL